ncbi:FAD-dependent oxidoreductase [Pseudonocardia pini]|uniref:FAD-dependent oxidoreductase n=1 Tax=Pseudonocardia pini TaxID=2758030 RepID=UPI0015F0BF41|nr:NAD(P)/FAD-dependent oxidoreductase [Pseudonocardia pini]
MTTALVIGAGVAGPVLAMALQRAGLHAEVYEGDADLADERGSWLTLQVNGMDALRAVDAHHVVAGLGFPTRRMRFFSGTGKELGVMSMGEPLPDGTVSHLMSRSDLYRALRDEAVSRGAEIRLDKRLTGATRIGDRVRAEFADGGTAEGDLLIGCDGIRSRVRAVIDPGAPPVRYVPVLNVGGFVPDFPLDTPSDEFQMMFGKRCFFGWSATPDGGVGWFANPPRRDEPGPGVLSAMTDADWRSWLLELLAPDRSPACDIVRAAPGPLFGWATFDIPRVPTWHRDRMIVIGDAAHATSPAAGQGAAMAIEDAVVLAKCLRDLPVDRAFTAFEGLRRERVEAVVVAGRRGSSQKAAGPVGRVFRDTFMPMMLRRMSAKGGVSPDWLHRHHIEWDETTHV